MPGYSTLFWPKTRKKLFLSGHKYPGFAAREAVQLDLLRKHSRIPVPQVYFNLNTAVHGCEALIMETLDGINADITFPSQEVQNHFVTTVIENLIHLHTVSNEQGFGEIGGPFFHNWSAFYQSKIDAIHLALQEPLKRKGISADVFWIIEKSYQAAPQVFSNAARQAVLVHSDYNIWNMLVDANTFAPTGIIDPIDAGWCDPEIDLFHLSNGRPDLKMLDKYFEITGASDEQFWLRFYFYRFWDDLKHYINVGWYEEKHFQGYADKLEREMDKFVEGA